MQTKAERRDAHRQRMAAKKAARATRQPGFTPIRGAANHAIETEEAFIMIAAVAIQRVARTLPRETKRNYRPRPSRSDDPVYRKSFVRARAV